jgi:Domain of unknown function (DUF5011)
MKYIIRFALLSVVVFMFSCKKDNIVDTPTQVGRSKVTFYVVLTLKGPAVQSVVVNQPYVDSGATAVENGKPTTFTTSGTVDNSTVGIYSLTYTAVNQDGYSSSVTRIVAVIPTAPNPAVDLSGSYANTGSVALTATVTMVAPGVYFTDNCWGGGSSAVIPAYFFSSDGVTLTVPTQKFSAYGTLDGSGTYSAGLIAWTITLEDQGPFTANKSWQKQ